MLETRFERIALRLVFPERGDGAWDIVLGYRLHRIACDLIDHRLDCLFLLKKARRLGLLPLSLESRGVQLEKRWHPIGVCGRYAFEFVLFAHGVYDVIKQGAWVWLRCPQGGEVGSGEGRGNLLDQPDPLSVGRGDWALQRRGHVT